MASAVSQRGSQGSLFKYYATQQKVAAQCSESTNSLQLSMRQMNICDTGAAPAAPVALPPAEPRHALRQLRPRALDLSSQPSQENSQYTPDYLTPQEQLFKMEYEPSIAMQMDEASPAPSPRVTKRPRPHMGITSGSMDEECSSQSQSQSRSAGEPSTCSKALTGRPPIPKLREVQPPSLRNPYLTRSEDDSYMFHASQCCVKRDNYSRFAWDYENHGELGHGNFSRVYRVTHRLTGLQYAIKTNREPIQSLQARNMWLNEMQALAAVSHHTNIVALHDAWFEPDPRNMGESAFLKLELCGESLRDGLKRRVQLREAELMEILRQVASALKCMHDLGMVHLDVKPDNIYAAAPPPSSALLGAGSAFAPGPMSLSQGQGSQGASGSSGAVGAAAAAAGHSGVTYKLGDFGLAMMQGGQRAGGSEGDSKYLAPEALKSRNYLTSGLADRLDVFALGASLYELMLGTELPKEGAVYQEIRAGKLVLIPHINARLVALVKKMMDPDPAKRPTAEQILRTPFLQHQQQQGAASAATPRLG